MNAKEFYECTECETLYETHEDATNCCGAKEIHLVYQCAVCGEDYGDDLDANACCAESEGV